MKRKPKPFNLKKKKTKGKINEPGKGNSLENAKRHGNGPPSRSADVTAHFHGEIGKCTIMSQGPVTSFLPITFYEVFITALSGAGV